MSHLVSIQTEVRDLVAINAACHRLKLPEPVQGTARLFESEVAGLLVRLPGWLYPLVLDPVAGRVAYDNYGGAWGDQAGLGLFLQAYAVEKATLEARKKGYAVAEQPLHDGSIRLRIVEHT